MNRMAKMVGLMVVFLLTMPLFAIVSEPVSEPIKAGYTPRDMYAELPELTPSPTPTLPDSIEEVRSIRRELGEVEILRTRLVFGDRHKMFITAYCSAECEGSVTTSSGATCHRETDPHEPTTCAIDRRYFSYGDLFYVPSEDRVYVAEDTGSGVRGMWLDTYQDSMGAMTGYNTRYETVYEVEIEEYTVLASNYDVRGMILDNCFGKEINDETSGIN